MASQEPALVAKIFAKFDSTENPYIIRSTLDAALRMPVGVSVTLVSTIAKLLETPTIFASTSAGELAVKLASGGEHKAALQVLRTLLKVIPDPRASRDPSRATRRKHAAVPLIRAFDYATILHTRGREFASQLGLPYLSMLCGLLRVAISQEITVDRTTSRKTEDYSYIWKARLEGSSYQESAKHLLIPAVLDAAMTLCEGDANSVSEVIALISKYRFTVYDRIAYQVLKHYAGSAVGLVSEKLLNKDSFLDPGTKQEYDALAAAAFSHLSQNEQNTYLSWIDEGIDPRRFEGRDLKPESIEATIEHWKFQRLSPLKSVLPSVRQAQLASMELRFGEAKSYNNPIVQGGAYSIGDESPTDRETLGAMEPEQVIEHLRSWKPTPNDPFPFGHSKEGLGLVFTAVVTDFPERFTSRLEDIKKLDLVYVTSALHGFGSALQSDRQFEFAPVLALALWIAEQPATEGNDANTESETDFSGAKHNVIDLIHEGLKHHKLPNSERETIWKIIALLSEDKWGNLDYRYPDAQTQDAWFTSLNYLRPKAVRAAIQYVQWCMKNAGQTTFAFSDTPELAKFFNRHTDPTYQSCLSVRLIFGEFFPYLHAWDPIWTVGAIENIFPDDPNLRALRDVAWTAYLAANQAYDTVFAILEPKYRAAIGIADEERLLGNSNSLEHPSGLLSYHLLQQYWRGRIPLASGSLMSDFFLHAGERGRRAAIIYVGRSLRETTDKVPGDIIQRLLVLWENRLQAAKRGGASGELRAFSWWFFTDYFDDEWAIKSLHAGLKLTGGQIDIIMDALGRLSRIAEQYPAMVVECLQMIATASPEDVVMWTSDFITILKLALESTDPAAPIAARKLIEDLGIRGHLEYRNLLTRDPNAPAAEM